MDVKIITSAVMLLLGSRVAFTQQPRRITVVAVIEPIYADSAGHAIRDGRRLERHSVDSLLASLQHVKGATIWFSWSGGPGQARTAAQDSLLARLRASGIRVELRTDSTFHSRVIRP